MLYYIFGDFVSKYFYHGTDLDNLISILQTKEIKCRRLIKEQNIKTSRKLYNTTYGYNGLDYISICKPNIYSCKCNSAFKIFIKDGFCAIIDDDVDAIKVIDCKNDEEKEKYSEEYKNFLLDVNNSNIRFSDLKDEWQVKTCISIDKIVGIAIPFKRINNQYVYDPRKVKKLIELALENNLLIIDSSDDYFNTDSDKNIIMDDEVIDNHAVRNSVIHKVIERANVERTCTENVIEHVKKKILSWRKIR